MSDCRLENITWHSQTVHQKNGKTKTDKLFSALVFNVVKRNNISAHSTFISAESRAGCHADRERDIRLGNSLFQHSLLCHSRPLTLLFCSKEGRARCIMGAEESDDRKHLARWPEPISNIWLCNLANSCCCSGTNFYGLDVFMEKSHSWVSFLNSDTVNSKCYGKNYAFFLPEN